MRIRSLSDVVYTLIAWVPLVALVVGVGWALYGGVKGFETVTFGTEYTIRNSQSSNRLPGLGQSNTDTLMNAYASGDVEQMSAALDQVEAERAAIRRNSIGRPGSAASSVFG